MRITGLTNSYAHIRLEHVAKPWHVYLAAWQNDDQQVVVDGLRIDLPVSPFDWLRRKVRIRPANIIACEVSWPPVQPTESWETQSVTLLKWLVADPDPDLLAYQELMLNPPKSMETALGILHRDSRFDQLKCQSEWGGEAVNITINGEFGEDVAGQAQAVATILADQQKWNAKMLAIIEKDYPEWCEAQDDEMSLENYASRFRLETIEMVSPTMLSFWLDDGGLYGGHAIELQGDPETGFNNFALQG